MGNSFLPRAFITVGQVEGQRKEQPAPVIIEGEEEWEVEQILNKRKVRGKDKYLV